MLHTVIFELLVFCVAIATPVDGRIHFDLIADSEHVATVEVSPVANAKAEWCFVTPTARP